jgi:nuclear cap-binding protein subunit 1
VLAHLETLKAGLQEADGLSGTDADALARRAGTQALLHIGARSFSHFLNAVERYLPLLRALAAGGPPARQGVLAAAGAFWATSPQMVGIVFDKLMQYQVAEPADVVAWAFAAHLAPERWDVLRAALDKAHGRVVVARRRIAALRKEEDERRAKALADAAAMDVDAEAKPGALCCAHA